MTVENVLMCAASALIELIIVVQIHLMMPTIKRVWIYISKLKQKLLQDTNVLSHIPRIQKFADRTLLRTINTTAEAIIKIHLLDTMLSAAKTVKNMYVIFWIFPKNSSTELSNHPNQLPFLQIPTKKNQ